MKLIILNLLRFIGMTEIIILLPCIDGVVTFSKFKFIKQRLNPSFVIKSANYL